MIDRFERAVADIQRKWVPDRRLGVFDVALRTNEPVAASRTVGGVTTSRDALEALRRLCAETGAALDVSLLPDPSVRHQPGAVVTAALAPLRAAPALTAARVSDALHGEALELLERRGDWLRVRAGDGYHAWTHAGYLTTGPRDWMEDWIGRAAGRALSAELRGEDARMRLPLGARVVMRRDDLVETGDGRVWAVMGGAIRREAEWRAEAGFVAAPELALRWYGGAPYLLGGRSDWGIDCSGLVQATYLARGQTLPRDSDMQSLAGREVPLAAAGTGYEAGDVLCFAAEGRISHVALWAGAGHIVHASLSRGGVASEHLFGDDPAMRGLRNALVAVRRIKPDRPDRPSA